MSKLNGKVALVTGSSRGIGRAIAERLAKDGAFVFVNYAASEKAAHETVSAIEAAGGKAVALKADVAKLADIKALFTAIDKEIAARKLGGLDILVNNAGVAPFGSVTDTTEEIFDQVFDINVKGLFFVTQEAEKRLRDGGRVINLSSIVTRLGSFDAFTTYAATKGAVDSLTRGFATTLGKRGITVNSIKPGVIDTDMAASLVNDEGTIGHVVSQTALGRVGKPQDIADIASFLASDESRWVTGESIDGSGGYQI